jgi:septal ring factor EnvC (AmiA/AmiB activator)
MGQKADIPNQLRIWCKPALLLLAITALALPAAAQAQVAQTEAQRKELEQIKSRMTEAEQHRQALEKQASEVSAEVTDLQGKLIDAAGSVQNQEVKVSSLENQVAKLKSQKAEQETALARRRGQLSQTLAAMQRLSLRPPQLVLVKPDSALNMARSASLLNVVLPSLRERASEITKNIEELDATREKYEAERLALGKELVRLNSERQNVDQLLGARKQAQKEAETASAEEQKRVQAFAAKAKDLTALIAQLEKEAAIRRRAAEVAAQRLAKRPGSGQPGSKTESLPQVASKPLDETPGKLPLPARGRLVRTFGETDQTGLEQRGITVETRPNAQVVSPANGVIVFAGPFRDYGLLLIIATGENYHTLLAGLGRIDGVVGQKVAAGEPVGQMGGADNGTSASGSTLYIELRKQGKPINPLPWLAAGLGKVSG